MFVVKLANKENKTLKAWKGLKSVELLWYISCPYRCLICGPEDSTVNLKYPLKNRFHPLPLLRKDIIKNIETNKCWQGCAEF